MPIFQPVMEFLVDREEAFHRLTDVLRCKWTIAILDAIAQGRSRPSAIERSLSGLTAKVLNERFAKLQRYGLIERRAYDEAPRRTEYVLTARGRELVGMLTELRKFADGWVRLSEEQQQARTEVKGAAGPQAC